MLPHCRDAVADDDLRRQDDAASTDSGLVGGEVQRIWTGSEVVRPHADALQHHVGRVRGDRGYE